MARTEVTGSQIKDASVSLTADVTGTLTVSNGGTGSTTIALNNVVLGNGTGAVQTVAPGTSGNLLTSNGTTWQSSTPVVSSNDKIQISQSLRANNAVCGGGTIALTTSQYVSWSSRFIVFSNGRGSNFTTTGWFDITCPTSGTITGVGGASNRTATANGIYLDIWDALYYILPIGSSSTSQAGNFRVASYSSDVEIPHDWLLLFHFNNDNGVLYGPNGITLKTGQSIVTDQSALATNATAGFSRATSCAGTPTGTPASTTGTVPMVVDTTNSKLYFYFGGAWKSVTLT